ncbi:DUF1206 domain-containing protein [Glutamicibacter arilaitensis]|uniref:DUF1206 domain-containing protein n=1 Tax=Glutamicibacter arilaitensis TaxID=256701 RepID=UPI001867AE16|nr:DUF1206 domain-containing protein [Glutamicibacter arilaitensis]
MSSSVDPAGAARQVAKNPWFERAARLGYAANGVLHATLGILAAVIATGGKAEADQSGAMRTLADQPFGMVLLWVCAIGALLLGLWSLAQAFLPENKVRERIKHAATSVSFLAVGFTFGRFAVGKPSDSGKTATSFSGEMMKSGLGRTLLIAIGIGLLVMAGYYIYKGVTRRFLKDLSGSRHSEVSRAIKTSGMIGYPAKGVVLGTLGVLFIVATVQGDPKEANGIDGALKTIQDQPFGPVALIAIGVGLVCYAIYLVFRARYDQMD